MKPAEPMGFWKVILLTLVAAVVFVAASVGVSVALGAFIHVVAEAFATGWELL